MGDEREEGDNASICKVFHVETLRGQELDPDALFYNTGYTKVDAKSGVPYQQNKNLFAPKTETPKTQLLYTTAYPTSP